MAQYGRDGAQRHSLLTGPLYVAALASGLVASAIGGALFPVFANAADGFARPWGDVAFVALIGLVFGVALGTVPSAVFAGVVAVAALAQPAGRMRRLVAAATLTGSLFALGVAVAVRGWSLTVAGAIATTAVLYPLLVAVVLHLSSSLRAGLYPRAPYDLPPA